MTRNDATAALLQAVIGVTLLFPLSSRTFKVDRWTSAVWSVVFWLCGEGEGQLSTLYVGAATDPNPSTVPLIAPLLIPLFHALDRRVTRVNARRFGVANSHVAWRVPPGPVRSIWPAYSRHAFTTIPAP